MKDAASSRAGLKSRLLGAAAAGAVATLLMVLGWTTRLDHQLFDALGEIGAPDPDPRIAIVSIDTGSLAELGRWPWSRGVHARLVERLAGSGARGVALDVLLSESALFDPEGDALLARALGRSGRVVLPVYADTGPRGSAVELMPVPEFAATAAALGHVEQVADGDGEVRSLYLRAGLGSARWPALALALQRLDAGDAASLEEPAGARTAAAGRAAPQQWVRDYRVMLPHRHPPGTYARLSYVDVLEGRVPDPQLRGRWLLVNLPADEDAQAVSADGIPPASADVEFQANALDALVNGHAVVPLGLAAQTLLSIVLVAAPLLLGGVGPRPLRGHRLTGLWLLASALVAVLLSWLLLRWGEAWFAPAPALLVLAGMGVLWASRQLRLRRQAAQSDPVTGLATRAALEQQLQLELRSARRDEQPLSLLFLQIDAPSPNGEPYAAAPAEPLLRGFADSLRGRARRPRDLVARLGPDRFAVLLPETTPQAAAAIATTIHVDLANRLVGASGAQCACTTSIGIDTQRAGQEPSAAEFLARAETACERARREGGNRTVIQNEAALQGRV